MTVSVIGAPPLEKSNGDPQTGTELWPVPIAAQLLFDAIQDAKQRDGCVYGFLTEDGTHTPHDQETIETEIKRAVANGEIPNPGYSEEAKLFPQDVVFWAKNFGYPLSQKLKQIDYDRIWETYIRPIKNNYNLKDLPADCPAPITAGPIDTMKLERKYLPDKFFTLLSRWVSGVKNNATESVVVDLFSALQHENGQLSALVAYISEYELAGRPGRQPPSTYYTKPPLPIIPQTSPAKEAEPSEDCDADKDKLLSGKTGRAPQISGKENLERITIGVENDTSIWVMPPGKPKKNVTKDSLGFGGNTSKNVHWKMLCTILTEVPHTLNLGPSGTKDYGRKYQRMKHVSQKLLFGLNEALKMALPPKTKVFEQAGNGIFRPAFKVGEKKISAESNSLLFEYSEKLAEVRKQKEGGGEVDLEKVMREWAPIAKKATSRGVIPNEDVFDDLKTIGVDIGKFAEPFFGRAKQRPGADRQAERHEGKATHSLDFRSKPLNF